MPALQSSQFMRGGGSTLDYKLPSAPHEQLDFQRPSRASRACGGFKTFRRVVTGAGAVIFIACLGMVVAADQGQWQVWAEGTPAHYVFVGLVQVALLLWVLTIANLVWERYVD